MAEWPPEPLPTILDRPRGREGVQGAQGAQGPAGPIGPAGEDGTANNFVSIVARDAITEGYGVALDASGIFHCGTSHNFVGIADQTVIAGQLCRVQVAGQRLITSGGAFTAGNRVGAGATAGKTYAYTSGSYWGIARETASGADESKNIIIQPAPA